MDGTEPRSSQPPRRQSITRQEDAPRRRPSNADRLNHNNIIITTQRNHGNRVSIRIRLIGHLLTIAAATTTKAEAAASIHNGYLIAVYIRPKAN